MTRITLTFDNGPDEEATPAVLDVLRRADIRAIFFVVGARVSLEGRRILRRIVAEGHLLGNHTWSHSGPLGEMTARAAVDEITRTHDILGDLAGTPPLFRPVGGGEGGIIDRRLLHAANVEQLVAAGYTTVLWNAVPRDWVDPDGWVDTALALSTAMDHACVVLHDVPAAPRLAEAIARWRSTDAQFVLDVPEECTPIRAGRVVADLSGVVSAS
jgi:peptidoglycan-N-acetylglucosamine deacetylase